MWYNSLIMMKKLFLYQLFLLGFLSITLCPSFSIEGSESNKKDFSPKPASASLYNLGLKSYEQGDLDSAITYFKKAVELDPQFIDAYFNLGAIYKKQKNYTEAANSFQKAIQINPQDYDATFELASCYMEEKSYERAKKYFSLLPQDYSKSIEVKQNLDTINRYLAFVNPVAAPSDQAQKQNEVSSNFKGQLLVDTLTKPTKEAFSDPYRVVTGNFKGPTGIAKDSKNNIYIANFMKNRIERISPDGYREVFIEKIGIRGPVGLAIDENDNLYVANYNGDSIVKVTPDRDVAILVSMILRPYYLLYDTSSSRLFATVQGNDSLVEIDTHNVSKNPITSR